MKKTIYILILLLLSSPLSGCKKITFPTEDSKKIIGSWTYISSIGGMSGGQIKNNTNDTWIRITEKGELITYQGPEKVSTKRITIEVKKTLSSKEKPCIVSEDGSYQSFYFSDSLLYISDEHTEPFLHRYVKRF